MGPVETIAEVHDVHLLLGAVMTAARPSAVMVRPDAGKIVVITVTVAVVVAVTVITVDVVAEGHQGMTAVTVVVDVPPRLRAVKTAGIDDRLLAMIVLVMIAWIDSRWRGDVHAALSMTATRRRSQCRVGV